MIMKKKPNPPVKFDDVSTDPLVLLCPQCEGNNLHQRSVRAFFPDVEGSETREGTCTHVTHGASESDRDMEDNPSYEREGLSVVFECETCDNASSLAIYQHEGLTLFKWEHLFTSRT